MHVRNEEKLLCFTLTMAVFGWPQIC